MTPRILITCLLLTLPMLASAEIYKWKDKDGAVRYSDTPPPSNVQQESLYGKKIPKPKTAAPLSTVEGDINKDLNKKKSADATSKEVAEKPLSKEEAAAKRAKDAENQRKEDEAKAAELKLKQENCKAAQANNKTYSDGGRILRTNEAGEREYLDDKSIEKGRIDAQKEVDKYC